MSVLYKINSLLKNVFPEKVYNNIRMKLLSLYRLRLHVFTEAEIKEVLIKQLGIKRNSVVFIHSSINQIRLDFPFYKLIPILQDIVGPEGTLLFPCWQDTMDIEKYIKDKKVFDVRRTPTILGILPEFARREKKAFRSLSPTNSIVAIGNNAENFVADHHKDVLPFGFKSPFYKLVEADGIIIGIGVTTRYLSFVHCIEDTRPDQFPIPTRSDEVYSFPVKNYSGEIMGVETKLGHKIKYTREIPRYIKNNIDPTIARDLKIKRTNFFTVDAKKLYIEMENLAKKNITIYIRNK
jgi:aminoglycoside 3-N-acetyltransferase